MTTDLDTAAGEQRRVCINCGRTVPASHDRHAPDPDCPSQDACMFDMTCEEALNHWRKKAHDLRTKLATARATTANEIAQLLDDEGARYCCPRSGNGSNDRDGSLLKRYGQLLLKREHPFHEIDAAPSKPYSADWNDGSCLTRQHLKRWGDHELREHVPAVRHTLARLFDAVENAEARVTETEDQLRVCKENFQAEYDFRATLIAESNRHRDERDDLSRQLAAANVALGASLRACEDLTRKLAIARASTFQEAAGLEEPDCVERVYDVPTLEPSPRVERRMGYIRLQLMHAAFRGMEHIDVLELLCDEKFLRSITSTEVEFRSERDTRSVPVGCDALDVKYADDGSGAQLTIKIPHPPTSCETWPTVFAANADGEDVMIFQTVQSVRLSPKETLNIHLPVRFNK